MKQRILQMSVFIIMMTISFQSSGQVIIEKEDYPRLKSFTDSVYISTESSPALPTIGANQVWDYSNLILDEIAEVEYYDATNDIDIPNAHNVKINDLIFQGFLILSDAYEGFDDEGWYDLGRYSYDAGYSISTVTGGASDSLWFPENAEIFEGRINYLEFPVQYEDQSTQTRVESIPYNLSIAAFGLDNTPGTRKRIITEVREVNGFGTLVLPKIDGTPTVPIDVLMIKSTKTEIDSVLLGGAPAPAALLAAFGLTQGAIDTEETYIFYTPGFGAPVMSIEEGNLKAFYRPQAADGLTAINNLDLTSFTYFPNPVSSGESLTLASEDNINSGTISIIDFSGREVSQVNFESEYGNEIHIDIPANIANGIYMYNVKNSNGSVVGLGKLQIE